MTSVLEVERNIMCAAIIAVTVRQLTRPDQRQASGGFLAALARHRRHRWTLFVD